MFVVMSCLFGVVGCSHPSMHADGTSLSLGATNGGALRNPAMIPATGPGFEVPTAWRDRGNRFGTDELVGALRGVGARLAARNSGWTLAIADLSPKRGGASRWHRSHQSGRDVDLILASMTPRGRPLPPPDYEMIHYGADGVAHAPRRGDAYSEGGWRNRRLDVAANWYIVEELLREPSVDVQYIFLHRHHIAALLEFARLQDRPARLVTRAEQVLVHPRGVGGHDDHFHVRISCSRADRRMGCRDTGAVRTIGPWGGDPAVGSARPQARTAKLPGGRLSHAALFFPRG